VGQQVDEVPQRPGADAADQALDRLDVGQGDAGAVRLDG
jgi:hypothetical protein